MVIMMSSFCFQVKADVTEGSAKLADAISDDSEAVICATGFRPSWDLLAPWKVGKICIAVIILIGLRIGT